VREGEGKREKERERERERGRTTKTLKPVLVAICGDFAVQTDTMNDQ